MHASRALGRMTIRQIAGPLLRRATAAVAVVAGVAGSAGAQGHTDVIQGRVTTDSGVAIDSADIIVTMAPDRLSKFGRSDATGHYVITFPDGTGDYLVHISAIGRATMRKRVTRVGRDTVFTVDARLAPAANALAAVRVQAKRPPKAPRGPDWAPETGADQTDAGQFAASLTPDQQGDLAALAGTAPASRSRRAASRSSG